MFCSNCGKEISEKAVICPNCGVPTELYRKDAQQAPNINIVNTNTNTNVASTVLAYKHKSKWVALLLCLFLGYFGAHRFYVGKTGTGILYIFTMGLFGFGWIIDCISILIGSFRDKAGQPLI